MERLVTDLRRHRTHYDVIVLGLIVIRWVTDAYHFFCDRKSYIPYTYPDNKVYGANMGPIRGRQDPGGPHVGPMKFAFWVLHHNSFLYSWNNSSFVISVLFIDCNRQEIKFILSLRSYIISR